MAVIIVPPTAEGEHMVRKRKLTCIFPHPRAQPFWGCHSRFVLPELFRPSRLCNRQLPPRQRRGWCSLLLQPLVPGRPAGNSMGCHQPRSCSLSLVGHGQCGAGAACGELDPAGTGAWAGVMDVFAATMVKRAPLGAEALRTPGWSLTPTLGRGLGLGRSRPQPWGFHQV